MINCIRVYSLITQFTTGRLTPSFSATSPNTRRSSSFNRQREKTTGQIVNEFTEMLAVEQERAKERHVHGETAPGENACGTVSTVVSSGKPREKGAEKINAGVSSRTVEDKVEDEDEFAPSAAW